MSGALEFPTLPTAQPGARPMAYHDLPDGLGANAGALMAASYLQDSGMARSVEDGIARLRVFGRMGAAPAVEGYNAFEDEALRPFLVANPDALGMFHGSQSPEESQHISGRVQMLRDREQMLTLGGAFWTRMIAGMASPEVLATLPIGIGELTAASRLGRAAQAGGRMAGLNAAATAAEHVAEANSLPGDIAPSFVGDVALSALFGMALGGAAGAVTRRSVEAAATRHAFVHDAADGLRTPGVDPVALREVETVRAQAARAGDPNAVAAMTDEGAAAADTVLHRIVGEHSSLEIGELPPGTQGAALGHVVRLAWHLDDAQAQQTVRHEAIHSLRSMQLIGADEWRLLEETAIREDWLAKHDVENRWSEMNLTHEEKLEESIAEQFANWATGKEKPEGMLASLWARISDFFEQLRNGMKGLGFDSAEKIFQRVEGGEVGRRVPNEAALDPELRSQIERRMEDWAQTFDDPGPGRFDDFEPGALDGREPLPGPDELLFQPKAQAAASPPAADSQRLQSAFGLEKLMRTAQMPYYLLKNNRFTGPMGEALARWASELVQDPGLRVQGVNESASVEAAAKQASVRYATAIEEQDRLYFQYAGFDPATASPARVRLEQARQMAGKLPGAAKAGIGAVPEGKLSMDAFEDQVFRAVAAGGTHEIPEVAAAAKHWQETFFAPFQREAAAQGVLMDGSFKAESGAAVQREIDGRKQRIEAIEARLDPKAANPLPDGPVRERFNDLLERERGAQGVAQERLKSLADMSALREPYVFHNWLKRKVAEQRDELVQRLATQWDGERPSGSWAPGAVRAEIAVSHLLRESVADTLERAVSRNFVLTGMEPGLALERAKAISAPVRALVESMAPSQLGVEIRSMLAQREVRGPVTGLAKEVKAALDQALIPGGNPDLLLREIAGREEASAPGDFGDRARPGHAKGREINVPTKLIADFLDTSMKHGAADYARRMGAAIEMSRKMGDASMLGRLAAMEHSMLDEIAAGRGSLAELDLNLQAARDLRDKVLGDFRIPEDPSAYSIRSLRFLSNSAVMAQMGGALFSNITDLGRVVMAHGIQNVLGGAYASAVTDRASWRLAGDEAKKAGAALELTLLARQRELQDLRDVSADASLVERLADQGARGMQFVNLVAPWTQLMQRFSGALHQSEMVELSVAAAAGRLAPADRARLAGYGIDDAMASRIADAWQGAGAQRGGRLHLANTDAWADPDLVRAFRAQLATAVDASVMRPGAADRPNFMSAQLWQTTLLYKSFSLAASQRLVLAGLQQRDGRVLSGIMASVSIAWLVNGAAAGPYDDHPILSAERLFQAIDRSGALGIIGDLNNATEGATGNALGLRPLLQLAPPTFMKDPSWAQRVGSVTGAATSPILGAVWAFTDPAAKGDQRAGAIRRLLPGQNLIWLEGGFRALGREAGAAIGDPSSAGGRPIDLPGYLGGRP